MAFCTQCGNMIEDGSEFCQFCGAKMEKPSVLNMNPSKEDANVIVPEPVSNTKTTSNTNSFVLADGEVVVRKYTCARTKRPDTVGYMTVTNKRLVFSGMPVSGGSRISQEVQIDSVSGLHTSYGTNINIVKAVIGGIFAILGLALLIKSAESYYGGDILIGAGLTLLAIAVALLLTASRKNFLLKVFSSKATGSPISIGEGATSIMGNSAMFSVAGEPAADTDRMIRELGALVSDLQTKGDLAIEEWKNRQ